MPFRIKFIPLVLQKESDVFFNQNASRNVPRAKYEKRDHPVAVVGGGPLLDLEALRKWPGEIWAVNRTADYLLSQGIDCTFFTVDSFAIETVAKKRLLSTNCNPELFTDGAECFALSEHEEGGILGGSTSAGRAPLLALRLGFPGVVFFGCEGSFSGPTHVDRDEPQYTEQLMVRADGKDYKTRPDYALQAEYLSELLREFPQYLTEQSGGLLRAMKNDPDWEVIAISDDLKDSMRENNGGVDLYDIPYEKLCQSE